MSNSDQDYFGFLKEIKSKIQTARIQAARIVNRELIQLYWNIGQDIVEKQEQMGWGKSVVERLSQDLTKEFPGVNGFSTRNLWDMRKFFAEYEKHENLRQLVAEIPWGQNLVIMSKVKDIKAREYYIQATIDCGWSRNVLLNQIKAQSYERHRLSPKQHTFEKALPEHLAEQADKAMKDVYMLDFLGIKEPILEREIENRMVKKIKDVILELGYGFCFIGSQHKVTLQDAERPSAGRPHRRRVGAPTGCDDFFWRVARTRATTSALTTIKTKTRPIAPPIMITGTPAALSIMRFSFRD